MGRSDFWQIMIALSVGTMLIRSSMFFLYSKLNISDDIRDALGFIPAAVLPALIAPAVVFHEGVADWLFGYERLFSFLFALLVCVKTRNVFATILSGVTVLYISTQLI